MRDVSGLSRALPGRVLTREADLLTYAYDGSLQRERPEAVVLARDAAQVQAAVRWCLENRVPYLARGAGTNPQRMYAFLSQ
ncbi:MAG: FAD-binding protein [Elusimicrobiota bacterium]